jgi:hypothetical protein
MNPVKGQELGERAGCARDRGAQLGAAGRRPCVTTPITTRSDVRGASDLVLWTAGEIV